MNGQERNIKKLKSAISGVAFGVAAIGAAAATVIARAGDQMTTDLQRINGAVEDQAKAAQVYEQIYTSARKTGIAVSETSTAFGSYYLSMSKNNRTAAETVELVTGLQASMSQLGVSTAGASAVTMQLGQALGKGVLSGDELVTLRENLPKLVDEISNSLKMTAAQFDKAAEKQELTSEKLIGPILAYARRANGEIEKLTPTMVRSLATLNIVAERFFADFDQQLGLSEAIARVLVKVRDWLEAMRQKIPAIGKLTREFGGLNKILQLFAYYVGVATVALVAMNQKLLLITIKAAIVAAAIGIIALALDDLVSWMRGKGSIIGRFFGPAETAASRLAERIKEMSTISVGGFEYTIIDPDNVKRSIDGIISFVGQSVELVKAQWAEITAIYDAFVQAMAGPFAYVQAWFDDQASGFERVKQAIGNSLRGLLPDFGTASESGRKFIDLMTTGARLVVEAWDALGRGLGSVIGGIGSAFKSMWEIVEPIVTKLRGALPTLGSNPGNVPPTGNPMGDYNPLFNPSSFGAGMEGRMGAAGGGARNVSIDARTTITAPINATGVAPGQIAAAAASGVSQGLSRSTTRGDTFARALGVAMPRAESATA